MRGPRRAGLNALGDGGDANILAHRLTPTETTTSRKRDDRPAGARWLAPIAYGAVLLGSAFAAYWAMFSQFAPYDDSGFFINSIRLFTQGQTLYNDVFSDYGPFSYELWGALFGLLGHTISTDSGRLAVVGLWLATSLVLGISCQRLTGRLSIGVIVQVLSFSLLTALINEPMHASDVVCALFAATVAVVAFVLPRRRRAGLLAIGAIVAALVLTKVNVGGFAAIAVLYASVMALPALRAGDGPARAGRRRAGRGRASADAGRPGQSTPGLRTTRSSPSPAALRLCSPRRAPRAREPSLRVRLDAGSVGCSRACWPARR